MAQRKLTPIYSTREDEAELADELDAFVIGLGEWIDSLQDSCASEDMEDVITLGRDRASLAAKVGYPMIQEVSLTMVDAARQNDDEAVRKSITDLTELIQRIRLGHRGAA